MTDNIHNIGLEQIPMHHLNKARWQGLTIKDIGYANPYDYKQLHRHDYYEILFIRKGGGRQIIDFEESEVKSFSIYIVFPGQVHLLQRMPQTEGILIQFTEDILHSDDQIMPLYEIESVVEQPAFFEEMIQVAELLQPHTALNSVASQQIARHCIHILLWKMLQAQPSEVLPARIPTLLKQFLSLLDQHIAQNKTVKKYADWLAVSPRKLNETCKIHWGKTGLQIIHDRLLLEIKRLLMTQKLSHKEIAYQLEFDSPAAFSSFVKKKTLLTPTGLQAQLEQIYK